MAEKILVVDDDLDTLRLVGLMLERQGYRIMAASSGQQALSMIYSERPDLVLLDLMMPDMDGIEVARRLRSSPRRRTSSSSCSPQKVRSRINSRVSMLGRMII
ncbi:MAG: response regulator [Anaerolineales bacterium]|nr:response regulator [Anaerolineales bacterium]